MVPRQGEMPRPTEKLDLILNTAAVPMNWDGHLDLLDVDGTLSIVGMPVEPMSIDVGSLLSNGVE